MKLKIGVNLELPLDAVTKRLAFVGTVGSGKTYGASRLAELMIEAKAQVVVLDPVGVWFGLRLDANGKDKGISIPVFGGLHGDIPIEPTGGTLIADILVDKGICAIIDVSQFEYDTDKARFAGDFAARLFFRKKSKPSAIHLFLEECQEFIPQNPQKGEEKMLHTFVRMWKIGRNFGIGGSLISQRPQEVNKKALNLSQCLFAFQTMGTHERKAIEEWIKDKALDLDIAQDLPKLKVGQPHVWAPAWLGISEQVKITKKWTFNASSTPEVGQGLVKASELAPIDLENLAAQMKETIERAKQSDPNELKKKIRDLELQLKRQPTTRIDESIVTRSVEQAKQSLVREFSAKVKSLEATIQKQQMMMKRAAEMLVGVAVEIPKFQTELITQTQRQPEFGAATPPRQKMSQVAVVTIEGEIKLDAGAKRMLAACVKFAETGLTRQQLKSQGAIKAIQTWYTYQKQLRAGGLWEQRGDRFFPTSAGIQYVGEHNIDTPSTTQGVLDSWMNTFDAGARRMLTFLVGLRGDYASREEVMRESNIVAVQTFYTYQKQLKSAGLIVVQGNQLAANKETLFFT
jgi:hypothetical protein